MSGRTLRRSLCLACFLLAFIPSCRCRSRLNYDESGAKSGSDRSFFLQQIFEKYGHDGVITLEGFEHLLDSLGLGGIHFEDHHGLNAHRAEGGRGAFVDRHGHRSSVGGHSSTVTAAVDEAERGRHRSVSVDALQGRQLSEGRRNASMNESNEGLSESFIEDDSGTLVISNSESSCLSPADILRSSKIDPAIESISPDNFANLCPVIIYELDERRCGSADANDRHSHGGHNTKKSSTALVPTNNNYSVWLYSVLSVLIISLTGMVSVAIVPIIQRFFYQQLLHFFVALAVGSLTGDALLHLLPHAMSSYSGDESEGGAHHHHQHGNVWLGLTALLGMYLFFTAERLINEATSWKERRTLNKMSVEVFCEDEPISRMIDEKHSQDKHSSYGFCYGEVSLDVLQDLDEDGFHSEKDVKQQLETDCCMSRSNGDASVTVVCSSSDCVCSEPNDLNGKPLNGSAETVSDHKRPHSHHHHHRHGHGHTNDFAVPRTASATAWMVIAGDGLHNFSDGMAIGAAFAGSLTGGLSTAIAVFCHELPHELGDFALLLKAGMGVRQALLYNGLSSILCFFGMLVGVAIGNISTANSWVFAGVAGMFLYIALVDMVPELNADKGGDFGGWTKFVIHAFGIVSGITIMCLIAVYEDDLQSLFVV